jgi:hypothetical protein
MTPRGILVKEDDTRGSLLSDIRREDVRDCVGLSTMATLFGGELIPHCCAVGPHEPAVLHDNEGAERSTSEMGGEAERL